MSDDTRVGSVLEALDIQQLNCLNEQTSHSIHHILGSRTLNPGPGFLLSDTDEQLLLNIPFIQNVRVRSIIIKSTDDRGQQPQRIKIFINRQSLGFTDVQDAEEPEATQVIELTQDQVTDGKAIPLRYVRFQNVNSLHIFVQSNAGGAETRIDAIDIMGTIPGASVRELVTDGTLPQARK